MHLSRAAPEHHAPCASGAFVISGSARTSSSGPPDRTPRRQRRCGRCLRRSTRVATGPKTLGPQVLMDAVRQPTWGMTEGRQEVWGLQSAHHRDLDHVRRNDFDGIGVLGRHSRSDTGCAPSPGACEQCSGTTRRLSLAGRAFGRWGSLLGHGRISTAAESLGVVGRGLIMPGCDRTATVARAAHPVAPFEK